MIRLHRKQREQHVYIIGKTRSGKTTLLLNLVRQDIAAGRGVVFIDPNGDAATDILPHIPEERVHQTVYFEPTEFPIGLGSLSAATSTEAEILSDDLITVFRRLSTSWGERMDAVLRFAIATLLEVPNSHFMDLYPLLADREFQEQIVSRLHTPELINFWEKEILTYPKGYAAPILTRLAKFRVPGPLKTIFSNPDTLSIPSLMDSGGILIVNLGKLGEDSKSILGTILTSKIQIAAFRRSDRPRSQRTPTYLYIDEFQNFAGPALEKVISEAGKFALYLTMAHQRLSQIKDDSVREGALGAGTYFLFTMNDSDARFFRVEKNPAKYWCWVRTSAEDNRYIQTLPFPRPTSDFSHLIFERARGLSPGQRDENPVPWKQHPPASRASGEEEPSPSKKPDW